MPLRAMRLIRVVVYAVRNRIEVVSGRSVVAKIARTVIRVVTIAVTDDEPLGARAYEGRRHQPAD